MSTGRVGGGVDEPGSKKVKISHSSVLVQAIVEDSITWKEDPDFGYFVAAEVPGFDDPELLEPRLLYERLGRGEEYGRLVAQLIEDRREYLKGFAGLDQSIVSAL